MERPVSVALIALAVAMFAAASAAAFAFRPDKTIRTGTGVAAQTLCSDVFVSGLDPATVFAQAIAARPGVNLLARHMRYRIDRARREVTVDYFGHFASRSVYREGLGCLVEQVGPPAEASPPPATQPSASRLPPIAGPAVVAPTDPRIGAALDAFFTEPGQPPHRWLRAVVILKDGKVVAERYAPGIGVDTPLIGYSASKSMMASLVGVLVRQGRLSVSAPAPVAAWNDPRDPRRAITLDNLLRMTSGLSIAETGSGFDPASRMLFTERDMAGYAEGRPLTRAPGSDFAYSDASTLIVSQMVRNAAGGTGADVQAFARRELFGPLGMQSAVMQADATGTPIGSTGFMASARDWARLGYLYAHDGVVGGQRILPEGWVRYAATPTLGSNYGAGFWTAAGSSQVAKALIAHGAPCDMLYASGLLGQRVYVMPADDLVIVRLAVTQKWPDFDIQNDMRLIRAVRTALPPAPRPACEAR